jgi:spore germination protein YaaH
MFSVIASSGMSQGLGGVRKGLYGAKRQVMREVNRSKRDANQMNKLLSNKKRDVDPASDTSEYIMWSMAPNVPNSGMIRDYHYVYTFLHNQQEYAFSRDPDLKTIQWDSVNNEFYKRIEKGEKLQEGTEVMGWHPYWMGDSYKEYRYKMLSIISFYAYDINPNTGAASNPDITDSLLSSSLPDSAAKYGTKLFLSVTSFGKKNNHKFLHDQHSRDFFISEVLAFMAARKGAFAGVDLDFEEIDSADAPKFTEFVKQLSSRLTADEYKLILNVPYFNEHNVFDYRALAGHVWYFNIMGYDFSGEHSAYPGSVAPINALTNQPSLETAVNDFLNLEISGQQIILSLPLYGVTWDVTKLENGGGARYENSLPYYMIQSRYDAIYNPFYDALSGSFFYVIQEDDKRKMCWFENEISLDLKFKWAQSKNLRGIGFWALGYEQNSNAIWKTVEDNYGAELIKIEPIHTELSGTYGLAKAIVSHKRMIGLGLLVLAAFLALGFALSLRDWRVREVLFQSQGFRFIYGAVFLLMAIVGLQWCLNTDGSWSLIVGLLVGATGIAIINIIFNRYRDDLR